ncbi:hypothetical protein A1351_11670 [Methylosinus sp. R-45379]|nr:hypothetical protein A1351_11670 [Methylosinus sp. R-45379]
MHRARLQCRRARDPADRSQSQKRSLRRLGRRGENWAIVASLIETCKLNGVDPQAYMPDVLTKIVDGHLASKLDELMPWAYAAPTAPKDVA